MTQNLSIKIKRLPFDDYTHEGSFYAEIDGRKIGDTNRAFWPTALDAHDFAIRFLSRGGATK